MATQGQTESMMEEDWDEAFFESEADEAARLAPLMARVAAAKEAMLNANKDLEVARVASFRWDRPT